MTDNPINIFDVSIGSQNTGDQIIMFYALKELDNLGILKKSPIHYYQTHSKLSFDQVKLLRKTNYSIVCGSNLLTGKQFKYRQWDIGLKEMIFLSNFVLFGVGWRSYESKVSIFTSKFYKNILSKKHIHSVRDSYSKEKLNSININNVINTGCPTTWNLSESFCKNIPSFKSDFVVFTLTDYRRDIKKDKKLNFFKSKNVKIKIIKKLNTVDGLNNLFIILKNLNYNRVLIETGLLFINELLKYRLLSNLYIFQSSYMLGKKGSNNTSSNLIKKLNITNKIKVNLDKDKLYKVKLNNV